jgi:hypothetical protein
MSERDVIWQEHRLEEILYSNADPVSKVQQIIRLGFDPEVADEIVERHQMGTQTPVYYERLDFADLDDIPDPEEAAEPAEKTKSDYDQAA